MTDTKVPTPDSHHDEYFGEQFLYSFNILVQTVKIHQNNNQLVLSAVERFVKCVEHIMAEEDSFSLSIVNGRFYIQDDKLKYKRGAEQFIDTILEYFENRAIDGLTIYPAITKATSEEILSFARLMNSSGFQNDSFNWLVERLDETEYPWISIMQDEDAGADAFSEDKSENDKSGGGLTGINLAQDGISNGTGGTVSFSSGQAMQGGGGSGDGTGKDTTEAQRKQRGRMDYAHALGSLVETSCHLSQVKRTGIRKTVRLVQTLVENILEDDTIYMTASSIRLYDDYTYSHSVNVAMLSICLGKNIGLHRNLLEQLGLCGLFHDLGKIQIPEEIIRKPGKLTDEERQVIQSHSVNSVRLLLKLRASWKRKSKILLAPFEHHLKFNLKGYPFVDWKKPISLFGRILAIADVYDALTSARSYRTEAMTPDKALGIMMKDSGADFDPILLKVFVNMLGVYPLGTLVLLDDGSMGIVCKRTEEGDMYRPQILLLKANSEGGFSKGEEISLDEKDLDTGEYMTNIQKTIHPAVYNIQPAQFLLSD